MECRNMKLIKIKYGLIVLALMALCIVNPLFATKVEASGGGSLPYIEMKVKTVKVGSSTQVLVECWASNLTSFEGAEIVFTYDKTVLQPSYISGSNINEELADLESIKYENRPEVVTPSTAESIATQTAFDNASKNLLSNSFAFDSAYTSTLGIDIFRYLATNGNNEAIQFVMSKKDYLSDVSTTAPVLIGKFSFKQAEGTAIGAGLFSTKRIKVICDDNPSASDLTSYIREEANGEDCTEIVEFTYTKYGSISGTINIDIKKTKNIATIKVYEKSTVETINWNVVGNNYKTIKATLPQPLLEYTTTETDGGSFKIEKVPLGEYVVLVDKANFLDYIITNVVLDSSNYDIDLNSTIGDIKLLPGDVNGDGRITLSDKTTFDPGYKSKDITYDMNDDIKLSLLDKTIFDSAYKLKQKKTVISL